MKPVFILAFLGLMASASAQNLLYSRHSGYNTFIFRITNSEAREIYKSRNIKWMKKDGYFHTIIDSFPLYTEYGKKMQAGHYLKLSVRGDEVEAAITSVPNVSAQIVNNNTDLCIQVYDSAGILISNADVRVGGRHLRFDSKVKGYLLKKSNRKGIVEIEYLGNITFYDLYRNMNKSPFLFIESRILTGTPLKYIWVPVKFVFAAPVISVRDLIRGNTYSTGNNLRYFWRRNGFSRHNYDYDLGSKRGYFIFSKPAYLPGDTVRYKAFLTNKRGKPVTSDLDLKMRKEYNKVAELGKIKPLRPGSYSGQFVLADSLNLDLDRIYPLQLNRGKNQIFASGNFKYEDYELKNISLTVRADSAAQIRGKEFRIHIRASDENDLNIQDGRIELTIKSGNVINRFVRNVFVRDTLFAKKIKLEPAGETVITIPDSVFPYADLEYSMDVKVFRTDNEYKSFERKIIFFDHLTDISIDLQNDSLMIVLKKNGRIAREDALISGIDRSGYASTVRKVTLPWKEKINPYFASFRVVSAGVSKTINVPEGLSLVGCESLTVNDSLKVDILNPRNIPFTWFLYRANALISKGYGTGFSYHAKSDQSARYYLSLIYLWAGNTGSQTFDLSGNNNELKIKVEQPALVYPGQKVKMGITVTDYSDKPVEGVDLTALSYTKKFASHPPAIYQFPDTRRGKRVVNIFRISEKQHAGTFNMTLEYDRWKKIFSLDTVEYYKFLNHQHEIYFYSYRPADHNTQFAPFVIKKGKPVRINAIYVDLVPVYFSWINGHEQPYSFRIDSGYHFVEIRTRDKLFKIDSLFFKAGMKLIMSINDVDKPASFTSLEAKPYFSDNEKNTLARYLFPFRNNFGDNFTYLEQDGTFSMLNKPGSNFNTYNSTYNTYGTNIRRSETSDVIGPVLPGMLRLKVAGGYNHTFGNEPGFEFEFSPSVIKMRTVDKNKLIPGYLWGSPIVRFSDTPLSEKRIISSYNEYLFQKKLASAKFNLPKVTLPSHGRLFLEIDSVSSGFGPDPLFIVLMFQNDPGKTEVYPGNAAVMENLDPGLWSVILFYRGEGYFRYDSIPVVTGGRNYSHLKRPGSPVHDNFSNWLNEIIEARVYGTASGQNSDFQNYISQLQRKQSLSIYSGEGMLVRGTVKDSDGPLPGVTVMVKGTTIGTVTDINGNYSIIVPYDKKELVFSYIGYKQVEAGVTSEINDVTLVPEVMALQEVVVTGYGISRSSLSGRVAGVAVRGNTGAVSNIRLRGISSINASNPPLFVIDGIPFDGDISDLDPAMIANFQVLKDESMTAIYGSRAANGVVMISTAGMDLKNPKLRSLLKGAVYDSIFVQQVAASGSVRTNFRDYGYWKPDLVTDKNGKASFEVRFPDDVTNWSTWVMAMNGKKQSGSANGTIKSYKPLMAQLYTPRFLIEGDSANLIGKILNYTPDSVTVEVHTEINGTPEAIKKAGFKNSVTDTLALVPHLADTVKVKYYFERKDGYLDGEERKIPVFRKGLEMTSGKFFILNGDTTVSVSNDPAMGEGKFYAHADRLDVIDNEIEYLYRYSYECNEQMASRLIALLSSEKLHIYNKKAFLRKNQVNRLIRGIEKNQNPDGCWGWWDRSETSSWITVHVVKALMMARQMGYNVRMNNRSLYDYLIWRLESNATASEKLDLLYIMSFTDEKIDYPKYISGIDESSLKNIPDKFRLIELKQKIGIAASIDTVLKYENRTMFGNIWFGKERNERSVYINEVQTTLAAYRIIRQSRSKDNDYLERIRNYFFERRRLGRWQNTFESASIIETILPDMLKSPAGETVRPELVLEGSVNRTITEFPFELVTKPDDSIRITKTGTFPVYLTSYQHFWKRDPSADSSYFNIGTTLDNGTNMMRAGKPVNMKVTLRVNKDAQYVMMEIPVPGGCSYESKNGYFRGASHSEFFKDHVAVFYQNLVPGTYVYEIGLLPRYTGRYTVNPAKAELMYFPLFSSNNALKTLIIR